MYTTKDREGNDMVISISEMGWLMGEDGSKYKREKVGEGKGIIDRKLKCCAKCGAPVGKYHLDGCTQEACPNSGKELVACKCKFIGYSRE